MSVSAGLPCLVGLCVVYVSSGRNYQVLLEWCFNFGGVLTFMVVFVLDLQVACGDPRGVLQN